MKSVAREHLMVWRVCADYPPARLQRLCGRLGHVTARDILTVRGVPSAHRVWAVLRDELLEAAVLAELASEYAEHVLPVIDRQAPAYRAPRAALAIKRAWLAGEASEEALIAARVAIRAERPDAATGVAIPMTLLGAAEAAWAACSTHARWSAVTAWSAALDAAAPDDEAEAEWQRRQTLAILEARDTAGAGDGRRQTGA